MLEGYDQTREVLDDSYTVVHSVARGPDGVGMALATRLPLRAAHEVDLQVNARTADFAATAIVAQVDAPDIGPVVFVHHLPSYQPAFEYEREVQTVRIARAIEAVVGPEPAEAGPPHVIVAGDLDAELQASSMRYWTGRQSLDGMSVCYRHAWEATHPAERMPDTFTPEDPLHADWDWPHRAIDHILVRCAHHGGPTLAIERCERFLDAPVGGVWGSDHYGLTADLAQPVRRP